MSSQTNKQQIIEVLEKLNEKELQKVVDKMIEIKEESLKEEIPNNEEPIPNDEN